MYVNGVGHSFPISEEVQVLHTPYLGGEIGSSRPVVETMDNSKYKCVRIRNSETANVCMYVSMISGSSGRLVFHKSHDMCGS